MSTFLEEMFSSSSLGKAENIPGPPEAPWTINEDANLSSNSKKKIRLNNEWISKNDLIWILCVNTVSMFENRLWDAEWQSDLSSAAIMLRTYV